ncbi:ATP-binding cassette domain-containing protein [Streptomyces sp. SID8379]|uniref:ABC transporter ATP-binding protein n=1 Tax=Streptomyces sp. SID8379 TaxID=2690359 RepID=UPI000370A5CD|nr:MULTISPECIES: ABC transporter ATP-binding protein [unclassified Streptomyces]MYW65853.1 ATP-binding cassette domain-containing protein [Streptomyces sp. SID8379]
MTPPAAVAFTKVHKTYGDVRAVDGLDFAIRPGETVALLGPNGAGKSTTLDMLLGLLRPDQGTVRLFGESPSAAIRGGRAGAMLQRGGLMPGVSVRDLVRLAHRVARHPLPVAEIMRRADIEEIAARTVDKLSGGQVQRVRFALAITEDPELIVLDEPTAGMDVKARARFWENMRGLTDEGRTVLFATHYMEEADSAADRVLVMHRGTLLADTTPEGMKARAGARRLVFELDAPDPDVLRALPGAVDVVVERGRLVRLRSTDSDATAGALFRSGLRPRHLEITGLGLEEAYLSITEAGDTEQIHENLYEQEAAVR